jgi:hypothetical protein
VWLEEYKDYLYLLIATIPGLVNSVLAYENLAKKCKDLPYFKPFQCLGFYVWGIAEFLIPCLTFSVSYGIFEKPPLLGLFANSFFFGFGFVAATNGKVAIGSKEYNLEAAYNFFVTLGYEIIKRKYTMKSAQFWTHLEAEMSDNSTVSRENLVSGCELLIQYAEIRKIEVEDNFVICDRLNNIIKNANQETEETREQRQEKVQTIKLIIKKIIYRKDYSYILKKFHCKKTEEIYKKGSDFPQYDSES